MPASAKTYKKSAVVMGTDLEVTLSLDDDKKAEEAFRAVLAEMQRVEGMMSEWREGTPVAEINANAGKRPVKVPEELFRVIQASQTVSSMTGGAFDITWASMKGVWDFGKGRERVPTAEEIKQRLPLIDYKKVILDEKAVTVFLEKEGMMIGLGAIAKGYAVDRAMAILVSIGIKDAIVKAGGDMRVQGSVSGKPWEIGIRHPREKDRLTAKLPLTNISISTSGDYERFFVKDGVHYHHIMDPRTGYPARRSRSVTIIAPDTMTSDALSTAVFVMGPEAGLDLVKKLKGVEAVIVDQMGRISASPGINIK